MPHITTRKQSTESATGALLVRAQSIILITSIMLLGLCSLTAIARLHHVEQQLAAAARV